jgi:hypothetical protein
MFPRVTEGPNRISIRSSVWVHLLEFNFVGMIKARTGRISFDVGFILVEENLIVNEDGEFPPVHKADRYHFTKIQAEFVPYHLTELDV